MKKILFAMACTGVLSTTVGQVTNTATMDTTDFRYQGKVTVEGYLDTYYAFDFNKPATGNRPYAVSMSRHNELTINLAYISVKYSSARLRGHLVPGFGTYMNANYANESLSLRNIVEASAGVKLLPDKNIWIDVGVFGSPYTNESAISKDHLTYTRSFAPEYVPYYLSGIKLTLPVSAKINAYLYLVNGWQQIQDVNSHKSLGTQVEYRPTPNLLFNWNTYLGNERSVIRTEFGTRYFTDLFFIYSKRRWSATGSYYIGAQQRTNTTPAIWWQANVIGRYALTDKLSVAGRVEYFTDPDEVQAASITGISGFSAYGSSLGLNYNLAENVLIRAEGRTFFSENEVFERAGEPVKTSSLFTTNITVWF